MQQIQQPQQPLRKLNLRERMFVEAYLGDVVEAAKVAGYAGDDSALRTRGNKMLSTRHIMEAIKDRSRYKNKMAGVIAVKDERQAFWTDVMNNNDKNELEAKDENGIPIPKKDIPLGVRLKASELLGKSEGDFVERVDITGNVTITDLVKQSYDNTDSIEDLEAEYYELNKDEETKEIGSNEDVENIDLGDLV